jgi:hypothetical protein
MNIREYILDDANRKLFITENSQIKIEEKKPQKCILTKIRTNNHLLQNPMLYPYTTTSLLNL